MKEDPAPKSSPWWILLPLSAAFFYTVSNALMRHVATEGVDPSLTIGIRESVAFYVGLAIFGTLWLRGKVRMPSPRLWALALVAFVLVQVVGNLFMQVAFNEIGMAAGVAGNWAGVLLGTPFVGWVMLREKISGLTVVAIVCVLAAVFCLMAGAEVQETAQSVQQNQNTTFVTLVVMVLVVLGGLCFALGNCTIRVLSQAGISPFFPMFLLPGIGFLTLVSLSFAKNGIHACSALSWSDYGYIYVAGISNAVAFLSLILGLKYLTLIRASIGNATQLMMAPLAGFLIFHEPMNALVVTGVLLTLAGLVLSNWPTNQAKEHTGTASQEPPTE